MHTFSCIHGKQRMHSPELLLLSQGNKDGALVDCGGTTRGRFRQNRGGAGGRTGDLVGGSVEGCVCVEHGGGEVGGLGAEAREGLIRESAAKAVADNDGLAARLRMHVLQRGEHPGALGVHVPAPVPRDGVVHREGGVRGVPPRARELLHIPERLQRARVRGEFAAAVHARLRSRIDTRIYQDIRKDIDTSEDGEQLSSERDVLVQAAGTTCAGAPGGARLEWWIRTMT